MSSKTFNLEKFYEKDIIDFLEEKSVGLNPEQNKRDHVYQITEFLKNHDLHEADKVLRKMVAEYNHLSSDNVYKDVTFGQIIEAVKVITYYLNKTTWENELGEVITAIKQSKVLEEDQPDKITVYEDKLR